MENIYSTNCYVRADGYKQKNYKVKNPYSDVEFSVKVTKDDANKIISVSIYATVSFPSSSGQEPIKAHMNSFPNLKLADGWISLARLSGTNICKDNIENCMVAAKSQGIAGNVGNCIYYSNQAAVWVVLKEEKHLDKETAERYAVCV